jgi:hypothetical protein
VGTARLVGSDGVAGTREAQGHLRLAATADGTGAVDLGLVPRGRYRVVAAPADGQPGAATSAFLDVRGDAAPVVDLAERVRVTGRLQPAGGSTGVRVMALDRAADLPRPMVLGRVEADGSYRLDLEPGRSYTLVADPEPSSGLARQAFLRIDAAAGGRPLDERTLAPILRFTGTVQSAARPRVPGVVLQAFCDAAMGACLDPTHPLAEATTDADGEFQLLLPDPGP